ncbi:TPA: SHOCT domain-containing protein [Candidatus Woesearchaeota archaeon]|nr:SHOCT domain-containing protein [Candidatus Woesearchaeota archaeon]
MMPYDYFGNERAFFSFMLAILLCVAVIWLIVWFVETRIVNTPKSNASREILEKRYAKGEITKREYERMRRDLSRT